MSDPAAAKPKAGILKWALWGVALFGVAAVVYIMAQSMTKTSPEAPSTAAAPAKGFRAELEVADPPRPPLDLIFHDEAGKPKTIADFKSRVVVVNMWATWCAPCKLEMPTLAKLQAAYAGKAVDVVAISIDSDDKAVAAKLFIAQNDPLKFYHDRTMKAPFQLKPSAQGLPTTVIYGKDGLERGRISGEADWSSPEVRTYIDGLLAGG